MHGFSVPGNKYDFLELGSLPRPKYLAAFDRINDQEFIYELQTKNVSEDIKAFWQNSVCTASATNAHNIDP